MPPCLCGERSVMSYIEKLSVYLNRSLAVVGGVALICLMALATGNVLLRIFHIPYRGTYEIVSFLGAVVTAFSLGYTQQKKDHIVVDIVSDRFPKPVRRILDGFNYLVTAALFSIISWQTYVWGMKIRESGELSETLQIVYYPFVLCVSLGFMIMSLTLAVDFIRAFAKKKEERR